VERLCRRGLDAERSCGATPGVGEWSDSVGVGSMRSGVAEQLQEMPRAALDVNARRWKSELETFRETFRVWGRVSDTRCLMSEHV